MTEQQWWRDAVGYEVYIRSFADGDGDGVGDLIGLRQRLEHLAWLGVDLVWISPFYPSPMDDHGYDVSDYTGVEPTFGTLADFDAVIAEAHRLGLRVIIDLVPNHTSSEHEWFKAARSSRDNPYRDYYIWKDSAPDGGPPNNWVSHFVGPAWTFDDHTEQWWMHLFLPTQPDLNWANPEVGDEFERILRFWLDRGADGFRIDVAHGLAKDQRFPDLPAASSPDSIEGPGGVTSFASLDHLYDVNQPEVLDIYRRWRKIADSYDAVLVGEVYILEAERLLPYLVDQDGLHLSFWFKPMHADWDPPALRAALTELAEDGGGNIGWAAGSHDRPRAATRFGGGTVGRERALVLTTLMAGLPGVPFLYQGDELGMTDGHVPLERAQDPIALREQSIEHSRDGCRTPMLWEPEEGWGFTDAEEAWLPWGDRTEADTVAVQRDDPASTLHRHRALIATRRALDDLRQGDLTWLEAGDEVIGYRRGAVVVVANCGDEAVTVDVDGGTRIAFSTDPERDGETVDGPLELSPREAVIVSS